jgi:hypothetical protein
MMNPNVTAQTRFVGDEVEKSQGRTQQKLFVEREADQQTLSGGVGGMEAQYD